MVAARRAMKGQWMLAARCARTVGGYGRVLGCHRREGSIGGAVAARRGMQARWMCAARKQEVRGLWAEASVFGAASGGVEEAAVWWLREWPCKGGGRWQNDVRGL